MVDSTGRNVQHRCRRFCRVPWLLAIVITLKTDRRTDSGTHRTGWASGVMLLLEICTSEDYSRVRGANPAAPEFVPEPILSTWHCQTRIVT
jgi:hypothetical protein